MDSNGNIIHLLDGEQKLKELIPIPEGELARVQLMNRHDRRKWYREQRNKSNSAQGAFGR